MHDEPTVLGVDLSLRATGLALPDGTTRLVRTSPGDGHPLERIRRIRNAVTTAALTGAPRGGRVDLVVVEDIARGAKGSAVHILAGLAYIVRLELAQLHLPWCIVGTGQLKKYATGSGNADKTGMALALQARADLVLGDDNLVDAWWLRAMGLDQLGSPPVAMPKDQRAVLAKIEWPVIARG